jgi:glycerol-1-phosphatase
MEAQIPRLYGAEAVDIPGSRIVLSQLGKTPWAIVTSGSRPLVTGWIDVMKLDHPPVLVTAEDVVHGKPDPACYALAREKLGLAPDTRVLVIEDAPAGVKAGKGAGCDVLALATSHAAKEMNIKEADWVVKDLRSFKIVGWNEEMKTVQVEILNALV